MGERLRVPDHPSPLARSYTLKPMILSRKLAGVAFITALSALAQAPHLIPIPREFHASSSQPLALGLHIVCSSCPSNAEDSFTAQDLTDSLASRSIPSTGPFTIRLTRSQNAAGASTTSDPMAAEGYTITPDAGSSPSSLTLSASSSAGLFYAVQTLKQLIVHDGPDAVLHLATIRDWPAMQYRGVSDDLSRGPIPTLAFQKHLVRALAAYKINLYSPYFEHTQQYASNPLPAPPGGSISAADARALVAYAARLHVTIVPDQEAFGHLHHNLTWETYATVAETPHGDVLAPAQPGSLTYIQQMFGELAALYPGPFLHIGADETVDLGRGQTKADVDSRGLGPVYLDFLQKIVTNLAPLKRRILFWADPSDAVGQDSPELLKTLPAAFKQGTVAVAWEYNPQPTRGFSRFLLPFTNAGFETWVATGVNNWSRVWPNGNDALSNIQGFIADGQRLHSTGALNTIWYDDGEGLPEANWYALLFGAAASWQSGVSSIPDFQGSFGPVFHGDSSGALNQAQIELMAAHALLRLQAKVGDGSDGLFWIDPWSKDGQTVATKIRPFTQDLRLHAERALTLIAQARAAAPATPQLGAPSSLASAEKVGYLVDTRPNSSNNSDPLRYDSADAFPSNPTSLHNPDAIDVMELGARRFDLIGLKFQLADEIVGGYNRALVAAASSDKTLHATTGPELSEINGANGRIQDIRDTYSLLRDLYAQSWLRSNRPYGLRPVLEHYSSTIALWQSRSERFRSAQRQYSDTKTLPTPPDLGLPALR